MTPAQASGRYDFVTDVPIQGPTDEGVRAASCWWAQNVLPVTNPPCVDCKGPIPRWANKPTSWGGEAIRYGGACAQGFSLGAAGDPSATLTADQQSWVVSTIANLDRLIGQSTGTSCTSWVDGSLASMTRCFQFWYNANANNPSFARPPTLTGLRIDGVLDQDTLNALLATAAAHPTDFLTPFPAAIPEPPPVATAPAAPAPPAAPAAPAAHPVVPTAPSSEKGLGTGVKIGIGAATVAVIGGIVYVATKKKKGH